MYIIHCRRSQQSNFLQAYLDQGSEIQQRLRGPARMLAIKVDLQIRSSLTRYGTAKEMLSLFAKGPDELGSSTNPNLPPTNKDQKAKAKAPGILKLIGEGGPNISVDFLATLRSKVEEISVPSKAENIFDELQFYDQHIALLRSNPSVDWPGRFQKIRGLIGSFDEVYIISRMAGTDASRLINSGSCGFSFGYHFAFGRCCR